MQLFSRGSTFVFACVVILVYLRFCEGTSKISSSFLGSNGIIGVVTDANSNNQNSGFSYAALFSKTSSGYSISSLIHVDSDSGFGTSVSIGNIFVNSSNSDILLVAVGSISSQQIYVYDADVCLTQEESKSNITCGTPLLTFSSPTTDCVIGDILHFGNNFLVSSCYGNLISGKLGIKAENKQPFSPPLVVFKFSNDGTSFTYIQPPALNFSEICVTTQGQISTSAIDVSGDLVATSVCGLCSKIQRQQLTVNHFSMFAVWTMVRDGDGFSQLVSRAIQVTSRSLSCPKSIAVFENFLVIGYPIESSVDFYYYSNTTQSYEFVTTLMVNDEVPFFGSYIDILDDLLVIGAQGDFSNGTQGAVYFYQISTGFENIDLQNMDLNYKINQQHFSDVLLINPLFARIPSLNYQVDYSFGFQVSLSKDGLLVVSQDQTQLMWAFQVFSSCPAGYQWLDNACSVCNPGRYKSTPLSNTSFSVCQACPSGSYSFCSGITNVNACTHPPTGDLCPLDSSCANGAVAPLPYISGDFFLSHSNPDLSETGELDFENTFYTSCYPLGLFILFGCFSCALFICIPCPCWNFCSNGKEIHRKIVKNLTKISFYEFDQSPDKVTHGLVEENEETSLLHNSNGHTSNNMPFLNTNRAVSSVCSYFFLSSMVLVLFFLVWFDRNYNTSINFELRTFTSSDANFADLSVIDSSPFLLILDLFDYNGNCDPEELKIFSEGCDYIESNSISTCIFEVKTMFLEEEEYFNLSSTNVLDYKFHIVEGIPTFNVCRIEAKSPPTLHLSFVSSVSFQFANQDFYAQRVVYNASTINTPQNAIHGNSYLVGVLEPLPAMMLRGTSSVTILTMPYLIELCHSANSRESKNNDSINDSLFWSQIKKSLHIVQPQALSCKFDSYSYKSLSYLSSSSSLVNTMDYHLLENGMFQFNFIFQKGDYYQYITSAASVTGGTIFTLVMFTILDLYWIIEWLVPLSSYLIDKFLYSLLPKIKSSLKTSNTRKYHAFTASVNS